MKACWRKYDWTKSRHPEREDNYLLFEELVNSAGDVIARIEQFKTNERCFYATTAPDQRSGCLSSHGWARQWCETKTGNKVN